MSNFHTVNIYLCLVNVHMESMAESTGATGLATSHLEQLFLKLLRVV